MIKKNIQGDDFIRRLTRACFWDETRGEGGLNNKEIKKFIIDQKLAEPLQIRQISRKELCQILLTQGLIEYQREPEAALGILLTEYSGLSPSEARTIGQVSTKTRKIIEEIGDPQEEIYTLEKPPPQGWITMTGGIENIVSPITFKALEFLKEYFFIPKRGRETLRKFTKDKALWLLRWLGPECWDFVEKSVKGEIDPKKINNLCATRFKFLENFWNTPNLILFMTNDDATNEIQQALNASINNNVYIIRLSTTEPGSLVVQYHYPTHGNIAATRLKINEAGGINVPWTNAVVYDIKDFDNKFSETYFNKYGIELASPLRSSDLYHDILRDYEAIN